MTRAPPLSAALGLAIDLGTTNVVGFLIDLTTGARLASLGVENPQVAWGADVVTRLDRALAGPESQEELRVAAALAIQSLARDLAEAVGRTEADIVDVAVCGNTAMQHLLLGLPVRQLARAPFVAAVSGAVDVEARDLGLGLAPSARVYAAPGVGGFVGSDHVAALLATRALWDAGGATLVMDIGTNTEISLVADDKVEAGEELIAARLVDHERWGNQEPVAEAAELVGVGAGHDVEQQAPAGHPLSARSSTRLTRAAKIGCL